MLTFENNKQKDKLKKGFNKIKQSKDYGFSTNLHL